MPSSLAPIFLRHVPESFVRMPGISEYVSQSCAGDPSLIEDMHASFANALGCLVVVRLLPKRPHRSFEIVPEQFADIHGLFADVHRLGADVHRLCVDVHELAVDVHERSVDVPALSADIHGLFVNVHGSCADIHRWSDDASQPSQDADFEPRHRFPGANWLN